MTTLEEIEEILLKKGMEKLINNERKYAKKMEKFNKKLFDYLDNIQDVGLKAILMKSNINVWLSLYQDLLKSILNDFEKSKHNTN